MEVTKQQLIDVIHQIGEKVDSLNAKLSRQEEKISELQNNNEELKKNNQNTLNQIKGYIQELEQIKSHYVNSNNNTGQ